MRTDIIIVSSSGEQMEAALAQAEKMAVYKGLSEKGGMHLRLLSEEMMGLMRAVTGERQGRFWIEDSEGLYSLHLQVETQMDSGKREKLLSVATSGRNEAAKGLIGRLRDLFDQSADADVVAYTNNPLLAGAGDAPFSAEMGWEWTLTRYVESYRANQQHTEEQQEVWDELERSVVTRVADEVKVSIRSRVAELIIQKTLS